MCQLVLYIKNTNESASFVAVFEAIQNFKTLQLACYTRAKARVINSLRVFFFAQDLVSHAATSDFDQSLQILDACDYSQFCDWQFSSHFSGHHNSTSCGSLALQLNYALSARQKLNRIVLILWVLRWF